MQQQDLRRSPGVPTTPERRTSHFIKWFDEITIADIPVVGGKNASLGEMVRELGSKGVKVPNGFATTADAFRHFLREARLEDHIRTVLSDLDTTDVANLSQRGHAVRQAICNASLPTDLQEAITQAYRQLQGAAALSPDVAVRSSATAEDLPDASFAGQQETYLNVQGVEPLLEACKRCFASLFTDRAISYRAERNFDHFKVALSIGVQRMVRSDLACSGVMFTIDTETGFRDAVLISAAYGLGENVVQGSVTPDEYVVFKPTLKTGHKPILEKTVGTKEFRLVYDVGGGKMTKNVPVPPADRVHFALTDDEVLQLARWGCIVEDHYSARNGRPTPMDLEWAKDGRTGELFIVQARPETVQSRKARDVIETYRLEQRGNVLASGHSVGERIATGPVRVILSPQFLGQFQSGEVLVTDKTDPDWEPIMKKAAAIVTNRGGRTCHAAIVSRELGVPAIVGTEHGTGVLKDGQVVTVSCAEGEIGFVYDGALPFKVERVSLGTLGRPATKVMMNVANPEEAFALSFLPNDGVGLARMEFIVTNYIRIHPLALTQFEHLADALAKAQIEQITAAYNDKPQYFVDKLAQGVAMIAAAFYPKDVILRLSDFKTNEYANLIGGKAYEPAEENPMLGFRGACRYYHPRYQEGFALECRAVKKVREEMGLTNLKVMVPFCRTVEEGRRVQAEMQKHGLQRGENGLELYVMCEIPSNVILANEFADIFDGFSIGSNDLTQLILGVDRDGEIVAPIFDERNLAVKKMIASVIAVCRARGRKIGICGQAPSDYPEFAQFLVEQGINSISLNPDTVLKTTLAILNTEAAVREAGYLGHPQEAARTVRPLASEGSASCPAHLEWIDPA
ncbi:MAG TPA: phosphoenolpyruvate synthase, partial [Gemmataceae bacterium]|nr:phosphoenolpyruvate synthase [Gemmataceae bacterium]